MSTIARRDLLKLGGSGLLAAAAFAPARATAQTPRRGGTVTIRAWDPPHFDPVLTISYKTHVVTSFTHSHLVRYRTGPGVRPGTPMAVAITARECVEKFGDLRKPESVVGTGPWMLESYKPNISLTLVRNPSYFASGLPYIDRIELLVDEDNASRMAAFLAGKYDLGWEFPGTINRTDWMQIRDQLKQRRPGLQIAEFPSNVVNDLQMRTDPPPFNDVRVRQAISLAVDRQRILDDTFEGIGVVNGPLPQALADWALPVAQLGDGAKYYR